MHLLVWADGEPAQNAPFNGDLHASFQLTDSSIIGLYAPDGAQTDLVELGNAEAGRSYGSRVDGGAPILETAYPTPRSANTAIRIRSLALDTPAGTAQLSATGRPLESHRLLVSTNLAEGGWTEVAGRSSFFYGACLISSLINFAGAVVSIRFVT